LTEAMQVKHIKVPGEPYIKNKNQAQNKQHKFTHIIWTAFQICKKSYFCSYFTM